MLGKKTSGSRYKKHRKKKLYEQTGQPRTVYLGKEKIRKLRMRGGKEKIVLLAIDKVNVIDKENKAKVVQIKNVLEVPSNRFLARRNIIVKGAIIETELGKVKITNRPSQEGCAQGILVK